MERRSFDLARIHDGAASAVDERRLAALHVGDDEAASVLAPMIEAIKRAGAALSLPLSLSLDGTTGGAWLHRDGEGTMSERVAQWAVVQPRARAARRSATKERQMALSLSIHHSVQRRWLLNRAPGPFFPTLPSNA